MLAGKWRFNPDPIVITEDGHRVHGQHRLLAANKVEWEGNAPQFLVVWGVDKKTALLMDEAQRSASDRREIAINYAAGCRDRAVGCAGAASDTDY